MPLTLSVLDSTFDREVLQAPSPVLVDFWATWCAPCLALEPTLEELATRYQGQLKIAKVNIEENQQVAQRFGVRSLPTLLMFKGGRVVEQLAGAVPKAKLEESIKKVL